jgi:hypothetical protein
MVPSKVQGLSFREIRPHKQSSNDLNWFSPDPQSPSTTTPETSSFRLGVFRPLFSLCFLYLIDHLHSKRTTTLAPSSVIRLSILDSSPTLKHSERQGPSYRALNVQSPTRVNSQLRQQISDLCTSVLPWSHPPQEKVESARRRLSSLVALLPNLEPILCHRPNPGRAANQLRRQRQGKRKTGTPADFR